jgi:flagellar hook-basal body complex protein FliE
MNDISPAQLLSQLKALNSQLESGGVAAPEAKGADFSSLLSQSIGSVHELQQARDAKVAAFESGAPGADLTQVMISLQKASLSFQAMTEVRNKLVNAYQEVMNMPV